MTRSVGVHGVILAGGCSSRFGGRDKALLPLAGRSLVAHVIERLAPQVDTVAINSNRDPRTYAATGLEVFCDGVPGIVGPGAGILSALQRWPNIYLVTVAVDLPLLPWDLVPRLRVGCGDRVCAYAVGRMGHSLAALWTPGAAATAAALLYRGCIRVGDLLRQSGMPVPFLRSADEDIDLNVNTEADRRRAEDHCARAQLGQRFASIARISAID